MDLKESILSKLREEGYMVLTEKQASKLMKVFDLVVETSESSSKLRTESSDFLESIGKEPPKKKQVARKAKKKKVAKKAKKKRASKKKPGKKKGRVLSTSPHATYQRKLRAKRKAGVEEETEEEEEHLVNATSGLEEEDPLPLPPEPPEPAISEEDLSTRIKRKADSNMARLERLQEQTNESIHQAKIDHLHGNLSNVYEAIAGGSKSLKEIKDKTGLEKFKISSNLKKLRRLKLIKKPKNDLYLIEEIKAKQPAQETKPSEINKRLGINLTEDVKGFVYKNAKTQNLIILESIVAGNRTAKTIAKGTDGKLSVWSTGNPLSVLTQEGFIKRVKTGVYEATAEGVAMIERLQKKA